MKDLIYDWNTKARFKSVELCDETLRDGLQSPSVREPTVVEKCQMLELMSELGITIADIGLPGAGKRAAENTAALAKYIADQKLDLKISCAARTLRIDIEPVAQIQQQVGLPIEAYCFLGTSPIRQAVEDWDLDKLLSTTEEALAFALAQNLEVAFVTEDTTRSHPDVLSTLFSRVVEMGVKRLVLCDTVGHSNPGGVRALVEWTRKLVGKQIALDWHGHHDRGLG
ncbi:MAG: 2-isopropylmalate synthase, partial [Deltaproteobacteria bacterium]|nr:2-isopropylmalate synthase [Deltaproteobacteria bacterium]